MSLLKSKFGKFAVSTEKMAKINGAGGEFHCVGADGKIRNKRNVKKALRFVEKHGGGCSN
ncbi:hypothetical protein ACE193_07095 [Bernardetia sp. OM2101]|uniref:hypothetical protein n=1 Tax=Bernardetia sp. OM2101 TaxID=3344876 RepID=UPI0035CEC317